MTSDLLTFLTDEERRAWAACEAASPPPWHTTGSTLRQAVAAATDEDAAWLYVARSALPLVLIELAHARQTIQAAREALHRARTVMYHSNDSSLLSRTRDALLRDARIGEQLLARVSALGLKDADVDGSPVERLQRVCRLLLPDHAAGDALLLREMHGWSALEVRQIQDLLHTGQACLLALVEHAPLSGTQETLRRDARVLMRLCEEWAAVVDAPTGVATTEPDVT